MLLAIDIGNTNVVNAVIRNEQIIDSVRVVSDFNFWAKFQTLKKYDISGIIISSVVPKLTEIYIEACKNLFHIDPEIVSVENSGLKIDIPKPSQAGADRICNVIAAVKLFDTPAVVVDFGTATTYDIINEDGTFIGGSIAPGILVSANYLIKKAALLKETTFQIPNTVIGKDTITNLQAGIMFGAIDEVEGMIRRIKQETGWRNVVVILTGGFSSLISPALETKHSLAPNLTIDGMRLIYSRITSS